MAVGGIDLVAYRALMLCADCGRHVVRVCISRMIPREGVGFIPCGGGGSNLGTSVRPIPLQWNDVIYFWASCSESSRKELWVCTLVG